MDFGIADIFTDSLVQFTGREQKAVKTTLKAEFGQEAWESLHANNSRPRGSSPTGRVAIKDINHLGNEVMKVFGMA